MINLTEKSFEMRDLIRFNGRDRNLHENLAEHSFSIQLSLIDLLVGKFKTMDAVRGWKHFGDAMLYAAVHDMYEVETGDILSPTKDLLKIKAKYDKLEKRYVTTNFGEFNEEVQLWVKAADNYTVWKWCEYVLRTSHNDVIYQICLKCKSNFENIWEVLNNGNC